MQNLGSVADRCPSRSEHVITIHGKGPYRSSRADQTGLWWSCEPAL